MATVGVKGLRNVAHPSQDFPRGPDLAMSSFADCYFWVL